MNTCERIGMYIMHEYNCCDSCLSKFKKLNRLASRVEEGLVEHFSDFNLEYMIIYIKKRKIQLAKEAKAAELAAEKKKSGGASKFIRMLTNKDKTMSEPMQKIDTHGHGHNHEDGGVDEI